VAYYHLTHKRNLEKIQREGLRPAAETLNQNTYFGLRGNPEYSYLWSEQLIVLYASFHALGINPAITIKSHVLLRVNAGTASIERDYDQLLVYLELAKNDPTYAAMLHHRAHVWGTKLYELTEEGMRQAIDAMSDEQWQQRPGSYRTKSRIPPDAIEIVPWREFVPLWAIIVGVFTRPYYRLREKVLQRK